ncbi:hypothetical protein ACTWPT_20410 [Nonomuraea sp. 3N208]|uniref:hypothetical protein n=1 Tax=Nonomuraea sp. 3N208 TaxID=3457421 RepID=UPI003FCE24A7
MFIGEPLDSGLARLEVMASDLEADWGQVRARIRGLLEARPWGDGPEGAEFERALLAYGGPWRCVDDTDGLVEEIGGLPTKLRTQVGNTLATDAAIAESIAVPPQWTM